MSEADLIVHKAVTTAGQDHPHRKAIILLTLVAAVLSVLSVTALAVRNISAQNASVACQGSLLENVSAQNAAGKDARAQLRVASQVLADSTEAQSEDIAVLLDPASTLDDRTVAVRDFQTQGALISQAWNSYVAASAKADSDRDMSPTAFRC